MDAEYASGFYTSTNPADDASPAGESGNIEVSLAEDLSASAGLETPPIPTGSGGAGGAPARGGESGSIEVSFADDVVGGGGGGGGSGAGGGGAGGGLPFLSAAPTMSSFTAGTGYTPKVSVSVPDRDGSSFSPSSRVRSREPSQRVSGVSDAGLTSSRRSRRQDMAEALERLRQHMKNSKHRSASFSSEFSMPGTSAIFLPREFQVPKSIIQRAFRQLDQESPDTAGEVQAGMIFGALHRFLEAFGDHGAGDLCNHKVWLDLGLEDEDIGFDTETRVAWACDEVYDSFRVQLSYMERLYFTLDMAENSAFLSKSLSVLSFLTVLLSITFWVCGTIESVRVVPEGCTGIGVDQCVPAAPDWMAKIETFCVWVFTAEIVGRLLSVGHARRELLSQRVLIAVITGSDAEIGFHILSKSYCFRLVRFLLSFEALFDILSVVPYWVEMWISTDASEISAFRVLYLARVTRIFKLGRALNADLGQFNEVHDLFRKVLIQASPAILMTVLLILIALFFFGTFIWFCEKGEWVPYGDDRLQYNIDQSEGCWMRLARDELTWERSPFDSIPSAFWWTFVTISTVGYGDQVPYTTEGKLVASIAMLYGTVILGLPLFVVGATFGQEYDRLMKASKRRQETTKLQQQQQRDSDSNSKSEQHEGIVKVFRNEFAHFVKALQEAETSLGFPRVLCKHWLDGTKTALLDHCMPVAVDRLGCRVLARLAEAEELCMYIEDKQEADARRRICGKVRIGWHKLSMSCFYLAHVPQEVLLRALVETHIDRPGKSRGMVDTGSLKSEKSNRSGRGGSGGRGNTNDNNNNNNNKNSNLHSGGGSSSHHHHHYHHHRGRRTSRSSSRSPRASFAGQSGSNSGSPSPRHGDSSSSSYEGGGSPAEGGGGGGGGGVWVGGEQSPSQTLQKAAGLLTLPIARPPSQEPPSLQLAKGTDPPSESSGAASIVVEAESTPQIRSAAESWRGYDLCCGGSPPQLGPSTRVSAKLHKTSEFIL